MKERSGGERRDGPLSRGACCLVLMLGLACMPEKASAGLILGAEARFSYEDNVVGLLSDQQRARGGGPGGGSPGVPMAGPPIGRGPGQNQSRYLGSVSAPGQSPGDYSTIFSAEAGGYTDTGEDTTLFAEGFASHTSYGTYTDLDSTIAGISTGMVISFGDDVTARAALLGKIKRFGDSQRDSTAYAVNAGLKEKLGPRFWLRETAEYEKNNADSAFFSYTGTSLEVGGGYSVAKTTTIMAGGRFLNEKYEQPEGATIDTWTAYAGLAQELAKAWTLSGEYDLQVSHLSVTGTSVTDNIFSLAIRYSY